MSDQRRGILFAQFNAFAAAMAFAAGGIVLEHISPWRFAAGNYIVAVLANTLWWRLTARGLLPKLHVLAEGEDGDATRPLTRRGWSWLLAHTLSSAAGFIMMWWSFALIPIHVGAFINRLEAVIGVALGMWLLHERFSRRQWLGAALALMGVAVIRWAALEGQLVGFLLALGGALGFGLAEFTGKVAVKYVAVPRLVLIRAWIMAAVLCAMWLLMDPGVPQMPVSIWAWLVASGLLGPVLGRNAYMLALSYLPVSQVLTLNQTSPLYAALGAYLLLGEEPGWRTIVGGLLIIAGVVSVIKPPPRVGVARERPTIKD